MMRLKRQTGVMSCSSDLYEHWRPVAFDAMHKTPATSKAKFCTREKAVTYASNSLRSYLVSFTRNAIQDMALEELTWTRISLKGGQLIFVSMSQQIASDWMPLQTSMPQLPLRGLTNVNAIIQAFKSLPM
jgi:hypothetical protein